MESPISVELFRQDGDPFRCVRLSIRDDGSIHMEAQDMGTATREVWGDSDYEFWVDVPGAAIGKLVFALLREKFAGRSGAVDEFRAFCETAGVEHKWDSWA